MFVGGLLAFSVTTLAVALGEVWGGILAFFSVIGSVLAIFTRSSLGATHVAQVSRGIFKGLYSFAAFFLTLTVLLQHTTVLTACIISIAVATVTQVIALFIAKLIKKNIASKHPLTSSVLLFHAQKINSQ